MTMQYVFPKLKLASRLCLYAAFGLVGIVTLVFGPEVLPVGSGLLGTAILVAGGLFVSARHYRNKPVDLGFEDWQPASMMEFNRILNNLEKTRKAKLPLIYRRGCGVAVIVGLAVVGLVFLGPVFKMFGRFVIAVAALSYPLLLTGHVRLWTPAELKMRMEAFRPVIAAAEKPDPRLPLVVTPYLRLDKDKEGRQIPEDVRLLVEPRRKPDDFVGVQFQVAVNNGPKGAVPYLYAVFLCKGKGKSFTRFSGLSAEGYETEPGADEEYGFVVVRQQTGGGGYHTGEEDCLRLFRVVTAALAGSS